MNLNEPSRGNMSRFIKRSDTKRLELYAVSCMFDCQTERVRIKQSIGTGVLFSAGNHSITSKSRGGSKQEADNMQRGGAEL